MAVIGLKNFYVAQIISDDENGTVYDTPRKIDKAMNISVTPNTNSATLYGDDQAQEIVEELESVDVEISTNDLSLEDYAFLLGKEVNDDGGVIDSANDDAPYVAFGYEMPLSKGGKQLTWLYKGKFGIPSESGQTKQGSPEFQTPTISATFIPRTSDGKWRYRIRTNETNQSIIDNWFNEVQEYPHTP